MNFLIDMHTHTNTTPHAYSSLEENIRAGKAKGIKIIANTMHGPYLQDSPHWWAIANQRTLPDYIDGVRILKSVEANVVNIDGELDINDKIIEICDIVIGGFHSIPEYGDTNDINKNTKAIVNVIQNNVVDILVHLGNPEFPIDYEKVVIAAKKHNVAIEINNGSLTTSRAGSKPNCKKIMELCFEHKPFISLGSDAHFSTLIGEFTEAVKLIGSYDKELILNTNEEKLKEFVTLRGKNI
ncbi:PHP domain-containing protein [Psychrilyobacter atlanticus]|uniref:PHP domain-containing protein n=1 Tax=Psychrilyobacter atlanticus TaxID=271091 RepID=UPI00040F24A5|nr:PHP domain-containing protein [Psychrilyobacter atlanticus]